MKLTRLAGATICLAIFLASRLHAAPVNIGIDIDSMRTAGSSTGGAITTQPGFTSWDLTNVVGAGGSTITEAGVTFEIFGIGNNQSRIRASGGGGSENDLLTDFVFHEGAQNRAVGLRISGLEVGSYAMQSWHYDTDPNVVSTENFIQIEVRDQGGSPTIVLDKFAFQAAPASFVFDVTADGQVKEIIFREDDVANPNGDNTDQNRARLNGFTLTTVPEPSSFGLIIAAALATRGIRRRRPRR